MSVSQKRRLTGVLKPSEVTHCPLQLVCVLQHRFRCVWLFCTQSNMCVSFKAWCLNTALIKQTGNDAESHWSIILDKVTISSLFSFKVTRGFMESEIRKWLQRRLITTVRKSFEVPDHIEQQLFCNSAYPSACMITESQFFSLLPVLTQRCDSLTAIPSPSVSLSR